jgi:hypothetical protein
MSEDASRHRLSPITADAAEAWPPCSSPPSSWVTKAPRPRCPAATHSTATAAACPRAASRAAQLATKPCRPSLMSRLAMPRTRPTPPRRISQAAADAAAAAATGASTSSLALSRCRSPRTCSSCRLSRAPLAGAAGSLAGCHPLKLEDRWRSTVTCMVRVQRSEKDGCDAHLQPGKAAGAFMWPATVQGSAPAGGTLDPHRGVVSSHRCKFQAPSNRTGRI